MRGRFLVSIPRTDPLPLADWAINMKEPEKRQIRNRAVQLMKLNLVKRVDNKILVDEPFAAYVRELAKFVCKKASAEELKFEFPY